MNAFHKIAIFFQQLGDTAAEFVKVPKLLQSIERKLEDMDDKTQAAFADLRAQVETVKNNEMAAATLLQGLHDQLAAALNQPGASSDDIVAAISDITAQLKSDTDQLAAAVAANSGNSSSGSDSSSGSGSTGSGTDTSSSDTGGTGSDSTDTGSTDTGSTDTGSTDTGSGDATDPTA